MRSAESHEICSHSKLSLKLDNNGGKTGRLSMAEVYCRYKKNAKLKVYIYICILWKITYRFDACSSSFVIIQARKESFI